MPTKLTAEIVNKRIADRGLKLVGEYTGALRKTTFECSHGHQWGTIPSHVMGGSGCPHCASTRLTLEIVNERIADRGLKLVSEYTTNAAKTTFECEHGHQWEAPPNSVMCGKGCPHCASTQLTAEIVNERLAADGRGLKLVGEYTSANTKTTFECGEGHQWESTPANVMRSSGCPHCAIYRFKSDQPAILYFLEVEGHNRTLFKAGITNGTVEARFKPRDLKRITVLETNDYETGAKAYEVEQAILKEARSRGLQYEGEPVLSSNGNTELLLADPRQFIQTIGDRHA